MNVRRCKFNFIIVDEAHHTLADSYKLLFDMFPEAKKLGVTATPWRFNHKSFLSVYQYLITTPQVKWFIKQGLLADFDYVSVQPNSAMQKLINSIDIATTGDFINDALESAFDNMHIRSKLYESFDNYARDRKGIVYAISKQHAKNIAELYSSKGIIATSIDCDTPKDERQQLIDKFKLGEIQVLVNVELFTEGFDCPDVEFIQLARPTRSLAMFLQQVGRGLRVVPGKEKTIFIDNVGLYNYFGLPDANRKWQHHFIGRDVPDEVKTPRSPGISPNIQERTYDEDIEDMMVVRGSGNIRTTDIPVNNTKYESFILCNYYQVSGNEKKFTIGTLVKKKGKPTGMIENIAFSYDDEIESISFSSNANKNQSLLMCHSKLKSILLFSASLCGITANEIFSMDGVNPEDGISIFALLKIIAGIYNLQSKHEQK